MTDIIPRLHQLHRRGADLPARLTLAEQQSLLAGEVPKVGKRGNRTGRFPVEPFPWSLPGRTLHLILPGYLPPSANEYARSKRVRMTAVGQAVEQIKWALLESQADGRKFWRPRLEIRLWFLVRRRRDARTNWCKILEDSLVDAGLMVDDSDDWCETAKPVIDKDTAKPRTEITLIERGAST